MIRISMIVSLALVCIGQSCLGQKKPVAFPNELLIAEHSFIDVGPPNDFYELVKIKPVAGGVMIERTLITPEGIACLQPAKVEARNESLHETLTQLLKKRNPCAIPEKELHKELKRCKHCQVFSGSNVVMQASCGSETRRIRMDILDRDMFDPRANTPENTSWTMQVIGEIDKATGPGQWDTPIFPVGIKKPAAQVRETETIHALREGKYDDLFGKNQLVSQIVSQAEEPPPLPPSVDLLSATPAMPIDPVMPTFPPIARIIRPLIEGAVTVKFDVDASGKAENVVAADGNKILQGAAVEAIAKWRFPEAAFGLQGSATLEFKQHCKPTMRTNVN